MGAGRMYVWAALSLKGAAIFARLIENQVKKLKYWSVHAKK